MTAQRPAIPAALRRYRPDEYRDRPHDRDFKLSQEIVERIGNGEVLVAICDDIDMPLPGTFLRWCDEDQALADAFAAAQRRGVQLLLDDAVIQVHGVDATAGAARARVLVQYVEKTHPDRYGPRSAVRQIPEGEQDNGGLDYGAELRRRLDDMAQRERAASAPEDKTST